MDLHLSGKIILITGGEMGIGAAVAKGAAAENAIPVVVGRSVEAGNALVESLREDGHMAHFFQVELTDTAQCKATVDEVLEKCGKIDVLVNNAGTNDRIGLERGSPKQFCQSLNNNLVHYYTMAHYAIEALKETRGVIINISSKTGVTGQGETSGYVASKAGQLGLTREWAVELLKYGIRVNAVLPAEVMTELYKKWIDSFSDKETRLEAITRNIPLENRMTTADEIADMVLFLASSRASHITGQFLYVDGGYVHLDRSLSTLNS